MISLSEAERLFTSEAGKLKIKIGPSNGQQGQNRQSTSQQFYGIGSSSGLSSRVSEAELKRAYLQFARVYHPDVQETGDKAKFQKLTEAYERLKADQAGYTLTEEDLYDMYKSQQHAERGQHGRQAPPQEEEPDDEYIYKSNEEMRREFEAWKRQATTTYSQTKHDEFLKRRYYKMRNKEEFNTSSHFNHPNAERGPRMGPSQSPSDFRDVNESPKTIKIKIPGMEGFDRSPHFRSEAQDAEDSAEMRRLAIFVFSMAGVTVFMMWNKSRKKMGIAVQQRDLQAGRDLIYVDKQAMREMNLSWLDVEQMAAQPEKFTLSNHLKRQISKH